MNKNEVTLWQAYRDALRQGQVTVGQQNGWALAQRQYDRAKEFLMDDNMRNIVTLILAGLARKHGGQVVIPMSELGEVGDQISLIADQVTGLVTITLLPDYVHIGTEEPKDFYIKWDTTGLSTTTANITGWQFVQATNVNGKHTVTIDGVEQPNTFRFDGSNTFELLP